MQNLQVETDKFYIATAGWFI